MAIASTPAFSLEAYLRSLGGPNAPSTFSADYLNTHARRFEETTRLIGTAKRGKRAWYPLVQGFKPKAKLVWEGKDKGVIGDLYEVTE